MECGRSRRPSEHLENRDLPAAMRREQRNHLSHGTYAADYPWAMVFEEQFSGLVKDFTGDGGLSIFLPLGE